MGEGYALNLVAWSAGWHLNVVARLAIEENGVFHYALLEVFLVPLGPLSIAHGSLLTQLVPQFLGDVWSKWREQYYQVAIHALGLALHCAEFVHANHERCHAGIVRELLDVLCNLLDEFVNRLQCLGAGFLVDKLHLIALEE